MVILNMKINIIVYGFYGAAFKDHLLNEVLNVM